MALDNPTTQIVSRTMPGLVSSNSSFVLPARAILLQVSAFNNTANAVTGGLKFGTTNGGVDIVVALTVAASIFTPPAALLLTRFAAAQTIFIDAVVAWNSANVDVTFLWFQQ